MKLYKILSILFLFSNSLLLLSQSDPVSIDLRSNGMKLDAKFYPANNGASVSTVILLHGFPGNPDSPYGLADRMNKNGLNVLTFNYEGSFKSEGIFSWENCIADIGAAVSFLKQKGNIQKFSIDTSNIYVCGCSMGAPYALSAAIHNHEIKNIIAVVGGNDLSVYLQKIKKDPVFRNALEKRILRSVVPNGPIKGDSAYIHNYFDKIIADFEYFDVIKNADKFKNKKVFFITAWLDTTVPMEEFIIPTYRHLKNLYPDNISIKAFETDHFFANQRDELANSLSDWIKNK